MRLFTLIVSIIMLIAGCASPAKDNSEIVALVNGEKVTKMMLDSKINELPEYYRTAAIQHKKEILNDLIVEKLLFEEAKNRNLHRDKEVQELVDKAATKIIIAKLLDIETAVKASVSDADVEKYYTENKDKYLVPQRVRASHILLSTEEEAKEVLLHLQTGSDFGAMARSHSNDLTKERGGDLGYFQKGQMIPEFEKACFALEPGQMSDIVKTRFGYHIIKVTDKKDSSFKELSEVKNKIITTLGEQEKQQQFMDFVQRLKDKARIEIKEEAFADKVIQESDSGKDESIQ